MNTIEQWLAFAQSHFIERHIASPQTEAEQLFAWLLRIPRTELYLQLKRVIGEEEIVNLRRAVFRRGMGEPIPYIVGSVEFLNCNIQIDPSVLIPRPETEIMTDRIIRELPKRAVTIWDLCTGSGCIAVAIKKARPDCRVVASDISPEALTVALKNCEGNGVEIELLQGNLFTPFLHRKADIIVCNPPYVSEEEYLSLDREVREWEPKLALTAQNEGYAFYEQIAAGLPFHLHLHSKVYLEIGYRMAPRLHQIFTASDWASKEMVQDLSSLDRYLILRPSSS